MITEDYVSFEVAKLLKEKGFDVPSYKPEEWLFCMYDEEGKLQWGCYSDDWYCRVTLQMAMKWLRNKYKMFVLIEYSTFDFDAIRPFLWSIRETKIDGGLICGSYYSSYEKACEAAIKYCLENLI